MEKRNLKISGIATLELLIAFAILILNIAAVVLIVNGGQSASIDSETNQEALAKAKNALEDMRAAARQDFDLVSPFISTETSGSLVYIKEISIDTSATDPTLDFWTKKVTSTVTWQAAGRTLSTVLTTLFTNPEAIEGGDTCSSVLKGDWTNPQKKEYEFGDKILNDNSSGFPISSIQAFDKKMYVTVNNNTVNNDGTFFILDISDPTLMPAILGQLDNSSTVSDGLSAVAVDYSGYAYVANAYAGSSQNCVQNPNCAQLQIIDVGNSSNPVIIKNFKIGSVTTSNKLAAGASIFYKNGIVYLGLAKATSGTEFHIIDVGGFGSGSPANPLLLGSFEIRDGINSIYVKGNYAYIASPNNQELKILDVSNPSTPLLVGSFDAPGGGGNNGNGKSLNLVANKLYLGRTLLSGNEFYILDNSDPETNLPVLGFKNIQNGASNTSINEIVIRNNLAFLITNSEFQTWEISNPANITQYANPLTLAPGTGVGLQGAAADCEGNYIYVGSQNSNNKGYISIITGL